MTVDEQIAEAKSLWNEVGYRLDTTTPEGRLAMLAPMLADALESALAEVERLKAQLSDTHIAMQVVVGNERRKHAALESAMDVIGRACYAEETRGGKALQQIEDALWPNLAALRENKEPPC